jgi:hypothetical protein
VVRTYRKGHNADVERIGSDSSIDERLAYYRKKYGEDFQLTGAGGSSKSGGQKKKKRKKKPSAGKQGEAIKAILPKKL